MVQHTGEANGQANQQRLWESSNVGREEESVHLEVDRVTRIVMSSVICTKSGHSLSRRSSTAASLFSLERRRQSQSEVRKNKHGGGDATRFSDFVLQILYKFHQIWY